MYSCYLPSSTTQGLLSVTATSKSNFLVQGILVTVVVIISVCPCFVQFFVRKHLTVYNKFFNFISKLLDACCTLTCGPQVLEATFSLSLSSRITLGTQFKQVAF